MLHSEAPLKVILIKLFQVAEYLLKAEWGRFHCSFYRLANCDVDQSSLPHWNDTSGLRRGLSWKSFLIISAVAGFWYFLEMSKTSLVTQTESLKCLIVLAMPLNSTSPGSWLFQSGIFNHERLGHISGWVRFMASFLQEHIDPDRP